MSRFSQPRYQFWLLILILAVLLGTGLFFHFDKAVWTDYFGRLPFGVAAGLFIAAYVGITFFVWFSKDPLRIVGALLFGPYWSTLFIWIGELANAAIFFHLSRKLGREYVAEKFHLKAERLERIGRKGGVWHIFLLRTVLPFRVVDLAYGLTSVSFQKYLIVSVFALPARIFWIQFILSALGGEVYNLVKTFTYLQENMTALLLSILYLVFAAVAVVVLWLKERHT